MITGGLAPTAIAGEGATAMYTCNQGYNLVGEVVRTYFKENGMWNGTDPTCI